MTKWESEFNQLMSAQRDGLDNDYGAVMQQAWDSGVGNFSLNGFGDNALKFNSDGMPIQGEYTFGTTVTILCFLVSDLRPSERNNRYLESANSRSLLGDAKALLDQNGSLSEAALLLEAAIQSGEFGEGGYEAWILLGETRNMDEREDQGMKALIEGVKRAEEAGAPGVGMLVNDFINHSFKSPLMSFHLVSSNIFYQ
jgi:peroxin-5